MGDIVLIGSSIFEQWYNYTQAFPGRSARNLAIGGTGTADWQKKTLLPLLERENPRELIVYIGSNDILVLEENVIKKNLMAVRETAFNYDPHMGFAYFSIIKAPGKRGFIDKIERINSYFKENLKKEDLFFDTDRVFFDSGCLREDFFLEDQTHHPRQAYDAMVAEAKPEITKWLGRRA